MHSGIEKELDYAAFWQLVEASKVIGLTAPAFGDGDSVGTQCALKGLIEERFPSIKVRIINETDCPKRYRFLKWAENFELSKNVLESGQDIPDLMICVDGSFERIGDLTQELWAKAAKTIQVDHHVISGENVYTQRLYNPEAASTTEIIVDMLLEEKKLPVSAPIAQALYLGFVFDTGQFKHSNANPGVLRKAAALMESGFDHTYTVEEGLMIRNEQAFSLLKVVLANSSFDIDGRYVWSVIDYDSFVNSGADTDDREGLIDQLFLTDKCEIATLFFEPEPGQWKLSFRARKEWDVAQLARSLNPHGGGHKKAAGCSLEGAQESITEQCHKAVRSLLI